MKAATRAMVREHWDGAMASRGETGEGKIPFFEKLSEQNPAMFFYF